MKWVGNGAPTNGDSWSVDISTDFVGLLGTGPGLYSEPSNAHSCLLLVFILVYYFQPPDQGDNTSPIP